MRGNLPIYDDLDPELRNVIEDAVLNRTPDGTERLLDIAEKYRNQGNDESAVDSVAEWRIWRAFFGVFDNVRGNAFHKGMF